jgi:hypothetical protein
MQSQQPDDQGRGDRGGAERSASRSQRNWPRSKLYEPPLQLPKFVEYAAEGFEVDKPLRQRMATRCQPLLPQGEQIGYIIYCQGRSPNARMLGADQKPRVIAVTQDHVWVIRVGITWIGIGGLGVMPFLTPPKGIITKLPRDTRIGPVSGLMWGRATINGERVWIPRRFFKDVEAADNELTAA